MIIAVKKFVTESFVFKTPLWSVALEALKTYFYFY